MRAPQEQRAAAGRRAYAWVCALWALPIGAVVVASFVASDVRDPDCNVDLFADCASPRETAQLLWVIGAPVLVVLGGLSLLALHLLRRRSPVFRSLPTWAQVTSVSALTVVLGLLSPIVL